MELQIGQAVLRISNQTDSRLLEQTLKLIGAFLFCGKSKKDDPCSLLAVGFLKKYSFGAKRLILLHKNKINDKLLNELIMVHLINLYVYLTNK